MSKKIFTFVFIFVIGVIVSGIFFWLYQPGDKRVDDFKRCTEQYEFISPDLDCGTINEKIEQISDIGNEIESFADYEIESGKAERISVFFRDLNTRQWFGVNENARFYPASLAKLPVALLYYKAAEIDPSIIESTLSISEEDASYNNNQHYPPLESAESGKLYSVKELVRLMITYSDNAPVKPLVKIMDKYTTTVFTDLGIYDPIQENQSQVNWNITAKTYANLFRILYNSSYLRPEYSNTILEHLSNSPFKNGIVAGVPSDIRVAHKFGEAPQTTSEMTGKQMTVLNDCGIIYKKDFPYILCIMTQGNNNEDLEHIISSISKTIFNLQ